MSRIPTAAILASLLAGICQRRVFAEEGPPPSVEVTVPTPAGAPPVSPDKPSPEGVMYETVVTAARSRQLVFESPRAVTALNREEIQERGARTAPEALSEEPGVFVQETNYGGGAPIIRGQFGNRVLLLVDGIRLNNATYRSGPNQYLNTVDPSQIDRIEVVRGPGSALYGSDAIGGTINVLSACASVNGSGRPYGDLQLRAASADGSAGIAGRAGWSGSSLGVFASAAGRHFGTLAGGGGIEQPFTGYDQIAASGCAKWELRPGHTLTASVQTTRQYDVPRTDRSTVADFRMFTLQMRELAYVRYQVAGWLGLDELRATLSFGYQKEITDRYRVSKDSRDNESIGVGTFGLQIDGTRQFSSIGRFTTGVDAYVDLISTSASKGTISAGTLEPQAQLRRYPEGTGYASAGAFARHELPLPHDLRLDVEGRAGVVVVKLAQDDRLALLFPDASLPALGEHRETVATYGGGAHLRYAVRPWLALSAGAMLGFRAPNIDDFSRLGSEGPAYVVPTRGLKPERALSGELALKAARNGTEASVTYAYTYIDAALSRRPATVAGVNELDSLPLARVVNAESARYHTVEASFRLPLWRRLVAFGNAAWTRAEQHVLVPASDPSLPDQYRTEPGTKIPPVWGRLGIGWHAPGRKWFVETLSRFALEQTRLSDTDRTDVRICPDAPGACRGTPGWLVFSARAGVRLNPHARVVLNFENITDTKYRLHASGIYAPGRGMIVTAEGVF